TPSSTSKPGHVPGFVFCGRVDVAMFMLYVRKRAQGLFVACHAPTLAGTEERVSDMRKTVVSLVCLLAVPGLVQAAVECPGTAVPQPAPLRPTVIAPVSS